MFTYAVKDLNGIDDVLVAESVTDLARYSEMIKSIISIIEPDTESATTTIGSCLINRNLATYNQIVETVNLPLPILNYFISEIHQLWGIIAAEARQL